MISASGDAGVVEAVPRHDVAPRCPRESGVAVELELAVRERLRAVDEHRSEALERVVARARLEAPARHAYGLRERLGDDRALENGRRFDGPVGVLEENVRVDPCDLGAVRGQPPGTDVE